MPTAYVKKMADKHGISVGATEEKWERAKEAAGKKFKHGSRRYWPYVMGIFKRMFGEAEELTFKDFMLIEEAQPFPRYIKLVGPYVAKKVEDSQFRISYEVTKILSDDKVHLQISIWPGKGDDPTGGMWTFRPTDFMISDYLRSQINHEKADMSPLGVRNVKAFSEWARRHMQHLVDEGIPDLVTTVAEELSTAELLEADGASIPKGVATLPKRIMVGTGGYYLELKSVKPIKATFVVKRLFGEAPGMTVTISKRAAYGSDNSYMLQAHGEATFTLGWSDRSRLGTFDEVKPFDLQSIRQFARGVIEKTGLDKLAEERNDALEGHRRVVIYPESGQWPDGHWGKPDLTSVFDIINQVVERRGEWFHRYDDSSELDDQCATGGKVEFWLQADNKLKPHMLKKLGVKIDYLSDYEPTNVLEDKKEDGVKKSYLDFRGSSKKKELKGEMKREIKRFSKMSHKDKEAYPDDWTADQKYKAELKKKGKKLPKSEHTKEFERRYGK